MARISIERKYVFISLVAVIAIVVAIFVLNKIPATSIFMDKLFHKPLTTYTYYLYDNYGNRYDIPMSFRADLRKASNVFVYPDISSIYNIIWNPDNRKIIIAFANSSDNGLVIVETFEIVNKLIFAFNVSNVSTIFIHTVVDSYDNLTANESYPIIALIPPSLTNDTSVLAINNVIYIQGNTTEGFDLATIKFLMSALGIKVG